MMEIEKEMDVEDTHILAKQKTKEREIVLDYDYRKCVGCSICVALCPKKALEEGPLLEIAKGLDAPPVLIDLDACAFCGMCASVSDATYGSIPRTTSHTRRSFCGEIGRYFVVAWTFIATAPSFRG